MGIHTPTKTQRHVSLGTSHQTAQACQGLKCTKAISVPDKGRPVLLITETICLLGACVPCRYVSEGDVIIVPPAPPDSSVEILTGRGGIFAAQPAEGSVLVKVSAVRRHVTGFDDVHSSEDKQETGREAIQRGQEFPMLVDIASTSVTLKVRAGAR